MSKRTVWAVSQGDYSDYHILALFETEELAEKAKVMAQDSDSWGKPRVEGFTMFDEVPKRTTVRHMTVEIWFNGETTTERDRTQHQLPWEHLHGEPECHVRYIQAPIHHGQGGRLDVRGTNLEAVELAFNKHKAEILAASEDAKEISR